MNIVAIIGNVRSEPELRHAANGRAVCSFRVAVSRAGTADTADFFNVVAWERQAEVCNEYLQIGRRIAVEGNMRCRVLQNGDERVSVIEIVAKHVHLLSPARNVVMQRAAASGEQVEAAR